MYSDHDTHRWVGCPIRISTDQSLLAAPHGFSQRATSFIASWCQGIHRMPFSRSMRIWPDPRAKPSGKPANPPCTETITGTQTVQSADPRRAKRQTSDADQIKHPPQGKHSGQHRVGHSHPINSAQLSTPLNPIAMPGGTTLGPSASRRRNHDPFRSDNHPASQRATSCDPAQRRSASQTSEMPCAPRSAPEPDSQ